MGYITTFSITTTGKPLAEKEMAEIKELKAKANKLSGDLKTVALNGILAKEKGIVSDPEKVIEGILNFNPFEESCKWYEHNADMLKVSKLYPETVFILSGEGEEAGDLWKTYYLNGKLQEVTATITYDEFDPTKLV